MHKDTPINQWLSPMLGHGGYIYTETLEECKSIMKEDIEHQIKNLKDTMEMLKEIS